MQLFLVFDDKRIALTKNRGKMKLKNMYHFTRWEAGLKGLYIVMIRSTHRQRLSSNENDWKNRKKRELDQQRVFRYYCICSKDELKWKSVHERIWLSPK
jgi:hypothetical protein